MIIQITEKERQALLKVLKYVIPIMGAYSGNEETLAEVERVKEKLGK